MRLRTPERLAYFAFDLLQFDGYHLRPCPIEDRKALLRDVLGNAQAPHIFCVDPITGHGSDLFEAARQLDAEGIVSKRPGSPAPARPATGARSKSPRPTSSSSPGTSSAMWSPSSNCVTAG